MGYLRTNLVRSESGVDLAGVPGTVCDAFYTMSANVHQIRSTDNTTNNGTRIPDLILTIKPKRTTNIILCEWSLFGEIQNDTCFIIQKRVNFGTWTVPTNAGEEGYNSSVGSAVQWSSFYSGFYDTDDNSTPNKHPLLYSVIAGSTVSRNYGIAFSSSNTTSTTDRTFRLNRSYGRLGENQYENGISTGVIYEVAQ